MGAFQHENPVVEEPNIKKCIIKENKALGNYVSNFAHTYF